MKKELIDKYVTWTDFDGNIGAHCYAFLDDNKDPYDFAHEVEQNRDNEWVAEILKRRKKAADLHNEEKDPLVAASFRGEIIGYDSLLHALDVNTFPYGKHDYYKEI